MKHERLLRVPRSARTIQLVVNVPEFKSGTLQPPRPSLGARVWAFLKVAGPFLVAVAAIIISVFSLRDQSAANREQLRADTAAAAANERHQAQQVSFLTEHTRHPPYTSLRVDNFSSSPIHDVSFEINGFSARTLKHYLARTFDLWLGDVPACSVGTIDVGPAAMAGMHKTTDLTLRQIRSRIFAVQVNSMSFTDGNGVNWQYTDDSEPLQRLTDLQGIFDPAAYLRATFKQVSSCISSG